MSSERLEPHDEDRQGRIPPLPEGNDIFVQFPAPEKIVYPSLDQIIRRFPTRSFWTTPHVRIGRLLQATVQQRNFAKANYPDEMASFYEGAYAAAVLFEGKSHSEYTPRITAEVALDALLNMKTRRQFDRLSPQQDLLKQNEKLAKKQDSDLGRMVLELAFERQYPKAFVSGATVVMDLYQTAQEFQQLHQMPRQEATTLFPLKIENVGKRFKQFFDESDNVLDEIKMMQRENSHLYHYVKKRYNRSVDRDPTGSYGFMFGVFSAYDLFRVSAQAANKLPVEIPKDFCDLDSKAFPIDTRRSSEKIFKMCKEEIALLTQKDPQCTELDGNFDVYKKRLAPDVLDGLADGFALVLRAFRSVAECEELEKVKVDRSNVLVIAKREHKARGLRKDAEAEIRRLEEWYGGNQEAA